MLNRQNPAGHGRIRSRSITGLQTGILAVNDGMIALGALAGLPPKSYVTLTLTPVRQPLVELERVICRMSHCPPQDFRFAPMLATPSIARAPRSERLSARVPNPAHRSRS